VGSPKCTVLSAACSLAPAGVPPSLASESLQLKETQLRLGKKVVKLFQPEDVDAVIDWYIEQGIRSDTEIV
jgi:hypothetical protein